MPMIVLQRGGGQPGQQGSVVCLLPQGQHRQPRNGNRDRHRARDEAIEESKPFSLGRAGRGEEPRKYVECCVIREEQGHFPIHGYRSSLMNRYYSRNDPAAKDVKNVLRASLDAGEKKGNDKYRP